MEPEMSFIPVEEVLGVALNKNLTEVLLIGTDIDGQLYVAGSHHGPMGQNFYLIERARDLFMRIAKQREEHEEETEETE